MQATWVTLQDPGLGLAIVKHAATQHGGHVSVSSELGRGHHVHHQHSAAGSACNPLNAMSACILVIDDDDAIRANLKRFLHLEDTGSRKLPMARPVWACARGFSDLILCDVMMPEMDGFEVCRRLRADPAMTAIPFIFLTASVEMDDRRFGL